MKGFTPEDLKTIIEIKNVTANIEETFKNLNNITKKSSQLTAEVKDEFKKLNKDASDFVDIQTEAAKSSSATAKAIKEQTTQQNVVKTLNIQIDNLYNRALTATGQQSKILLKQADTLLKLLLRHQEKLY